MADRGATFVAVSEIEVPPEGADALEQAFRDRLGAVEAWPGFQRLEIWRDARGGGRYVMVSWWDHRDQFVAYLRSDDHARSHARIPTGAHAPRPAGFTRYDVVAR